MWTGPDRLDRITWTGSPGADQLFGPWIPGKEDQRRLEEQERLKSHRLITGGRSTDPDDEKLITPEKSDDLGRFSKYIREIILYNSTPKVNLIG